MSYSHGWAALVAITTLLVASILFQPALTGLTTFDVAATVHPVSVDWDGFTHQTSTPKKPTLASSEVKTFFSGTRNVSAQIHPAFAAATNFIVKTTNATYAVTRINNTLHWQQDGTQPVTLAYDLPPPQVSIMDTSTQETVALEIVVSAQTPLRNSSYEVTLPRSVQRVALFEQGIDVSNTYDLRVSSSEVSFTNVAFTANELDKHLELREIRSQQTSASNEHSVFLPYEITFEVPKQLTPEQPQKHITITSPSPNPITFTLSTDSDALTIHPRQLHVPAHNSSTVTLSYNPMPSDQQATLRVQHQNREETFVIELLAQPPSPQEEPLREEEPTQIIPRPSQEDELPSNNSQALLIAALVALALLISVVIHKKRLS